MFSNELRARLSWMTSPRPSSIRFSKASIESALVSGPMLDNPTHVRYHGTRWYAFTHIEDTDCPQLREPGGSSLYPWDGAGIVRAGGVEGCWCPER